MQSKTDIRALIDIVFDWISSHSTDLALLVFAIAATALVSWFFHRRALAGKDIAYQLRDIRLLGYSQQTLPDAVEIRYKDTPVKKLDRATVILWNRSRTTIHGTDIVGADQLRLSFTASQILDAKIVGTSRQIIGAEIRVFESYPQDSSWSQNVAIDFDYLDQGDGVLVEVLYAPQTTNAFVNPDIRGTIKGIPSGPRRLPWNPNPGFMDHILPLLVFVVAGSVFGIALAYAAILYDGEGQLTSVVAGLLSLPCITFSIYLCYQLYLLSVVELSWAGSSPVISSLLSFLLRPTIVENGNLRGVACQLDERREPRCGIYRWQKDNEGEIHNLSAFPTSLGLLLR